MQLNYPFRIVNGQVASTTEDLHVRQMIEQVLFTIPGERVNRPDFGCGVQRLVFESATSELAVINDALIRSNLQRYLGDVINVTLLTVVADSPSVVITIGYSVLRTKQRYQSQFTFGPP